MIDIRQLPNLTIEQKDFVGEFYRLFNWDSPGSNHHIANVEPLLFEGANALSEFLVYANTKLYLCFDINVGSSLIATPAFGSINFFNELNLNFLYSMNKNICYDSIAPAINYVRNNSKMKNVWFSRIQFTNVVYTYMKFIGYRITLD